jgi:hypothetical protein
MAKQSVAAKVIGGVASAGAASVAKSALDKGWRASTGKKPPKKATAKEGTLLEAIVWAVLSAVALAVVETLVKRKLADFFDPGPEEPSPDADED